MSLAWTLYFGWPDSGAGMPLSAAGARRHWRARAGISLVNASPYSSVVASRPRRSITSANVISTYRSSWSMALETWSGAHAGRSPSMILPLEWNSVGAPNDTPIIWPAQPPRTRSSSVGPSRWPGRLVTRPRMPEGRGCHDGRRRSETGNAHHGGHSNPGGCQPLGNSVKHDARKRLPRKFIPVTERIDHRGQVRLGFADVDDQNRPGSPESGLVTPQTSADNSPGRGAGRRVDRDGLARPGAIRTRQPRSRRACPQRGPSAELPAQPRRADSARAPGLDGRRADPRHPEPLLHRHRPRHRRRGHQVRLHAAAGQLRRLGRPRTRLPRHVPRRGRRRAARDPVAERRARSTASSSKPACRS